MPTKQLPRAVLFDLDGTLIDSYAAITASVNEVRRSRNLRPLEVAHVRPKVGRGVENLLRSTVEGTDLSIDIPIYKDHHANACIEHTRLLPGAREIIASLRHRGIAVGICSNKPRHFTNLILKTFAWDDQFDVICGPEDVASPKPDPAMLLEASKRLSLGTELMLYVGDMEVDVLAGRAAGCIVWVVSTGSDSVETLRNANPDAVFESLCEMSFELGFSDTFCAGQGD